jgi:hypothetical protein
MTKQKAQPELWIQQRRYNVEAASAIMTIMKQSDFKSIKRFEIEEGFNDMSVIELLVISTDFLSLISDRFVDHESNCAV